MKYVVSQTFEIGDPCREEFDTMDAAEAGAEKLRSGIAAMVADWETPETKPIQRTGCTAEIAAWDEAARVAGVQFDDSGEVTEGSPCVYGPAGGRVIAEAAVVIEIEEDGEVV